MALWFRAAERIDVPAGGVVPGPADIDPLPEQTAAPADEAELAAGWLAWWRARPGRYLIPESLRDGPRWPRVLRELLIPYA